MGQIERTDGRTDAAMPLVPPGKDVGQSGEPGEQERRPMRAKPGTAQAQAQVALPSSREQDKEQAGSVRRKRGWQER